MVHSGFGLGSATLMNHRDGALPWFKSQDTRGILEGFNCDLWSAKTKAHGYRTHKNFINMAYLNLGKLDLRLPVRHVGQPVTIDCRKANPQLES